MKWRLWRIFTRKQTPSTRCMSNGRALCSTFLPVADDSTQELAAYYAEDPAKVRHDGSAHCLCALLLTATNAKFSPEEFFKTVWKFISDVRDGYKGGVLSLSATRTHAVCSLQRNSVLAAAKKKEEARLRIEEAKASVTVRLQVFCFCEPFIHRPVCPSRRRSLQLSRRKRRRRCT